MVLSVALSTSTSAAVVPTALVSWIAVAIRGRLSTGGEPPSAHV